MSAFLRQQIDAVVTPLLAPALASLQETARHLVRLIALALVALACLIGAIIFASVAIYSWLASTAGAIVAALVLAGIYLAIALVCFFGIWASGARKSTPPKRNGTLEEDDSKGNEEVTQAAATSAFQSHEQADNIDRALAPIIAILQEAGLQRANLLVLIAGAIAKQIRPFALVAGAFATGFAFGRR